VGIEQSSAAATVLENKEKNRFSNVLPCECFTHTHTHTHTGEPIIMRIVMVFILYKLYILSPILTQPLNLPITENHCIFTYSINKILFSMFFLNLMYYDVLINHIYIVITV